MANFSKPQSMMTMLVALFALLQVSVAFQHGAYHSHAVRSVDEAVKENMDNIADALNKRASGTFTAIKGVCSSSSSSSSCESYPRLEIRQLAKNADQWNLYLLGMERFQAKAKTDTLSYYQVAGVHGRPYKTWNNFPTPLLNQAGFCPHAQTLFGSWHRPYLAVFEQAWYQSVLEVIATFPSSQQSRWKTAAATLRMPYWDWAIDGGSNTVPTTLRAQKITVTKPSGSVSISNPLYSYTFGSSLPSEIGGGPWSNWSITLRRPVANPTRSNANELNARFNSLRVSLRDRVYSLFASKQAWGNVSTSAIGVTTSLGIVDSFESIHDTVHTTAGGETGGHMYYLDLSSFDPIFWLHHTNIDRLLAMYQLVVPNSFVSNGNINRPMAQWNQGDAKNVYTPLKPFTKDTAGNYYTSVDVKETRVLGYYYPETSTRTYSQVVKAVTSLYSGGTKTLTKRATDDSTGQYLGTLLKAGDYQHVLSIIADKFALAGSYTVHCFIGQSNSTSSNSTVTAPYGNSTTLYSNTTSSSDADYDASKDYTQQANYVGSYGVLGAMMAGGGNSSSAVMTKGSLPLTSCLQGKVAYGELSSLSPDVVEPYLAKNLHYKVVGVNGELNADDIPNFHISVKCTKVLSDASDDELPELSPTYTTLPDATKNLPAGKPFTYIPTAIDIPLPDSPIYSQPSYSSGSSSSGGHSSGSSSSGGHYYNSGSSSGGHYNGGSSNGGSSNGGHSNGGYSNGARPTSPSNGVFPYPKLPYEEAGYCINKQVIEYVDPSGNLLYTEM